MVFSPNGASADSGGGAGSLQLELLGSYRQPKPAAAFDQSAAEIVAYDAGSARLFVTNGHRQTVDVLDIHKPAAAKLVTTIDITAPEGEAGFAGAGANSVAVADGLVAVAIEAEDSVAPGAVGLYDTEGALLALYPVGAMPDMLLFTPDGKRILVANEGEPAGGIDPEGSVSIIELGQDVRRARVVTVTFNAFDQRVDALRAEGLRLFPDVAVPPLAAGQIRVSQDLEPEYIAVNPLANEAMVVLQEANALALLDLDAQRFTALLPLGAVDYLAPGKALDPSDRDGGIRIRPWPLRGMYMPDGLASFTVGGETWYISANEGDHRGKATKTQRGDAVRYKSLGKVRSFGREGLAPAKALVEQGLAADAALGRLQVSSIDGIGPDGKLEQIYSFGSRSFSVIDAGGNVVWDSGDQLEQLVAAWQPAFFNASSDANRDKGDRLPGLDARSPDKGPEPEAVTTAFLYGRHYAFIGLERFGGVAVYDVSEPRAPQYVNYVNNRDFSVDNAQLAAGLAGDLGPESLLVIDAVNSPTGTPLLVVANEVSGTISFYHLHPGPLPPG